MVLNSKLILLSLTLILTLRIFWAWPLNNIRSELEPPQSLVNFRQVLADQVDQLLPKPQAGLIKGIILGLKTDLPADFHQALKNTSTVHIVVASGQNLTILSGFILALAPLLGRKKTIFASITLCLFYALLSGLQIPIIRAAIMVLIAGIAQLFNRESNSFFILCLTAMLMLIFEPNWLLSVSFQLSFLATFGVVVVAPELIKAAKFLPEIIKEDLMISFSAQALTAPVIAAVFHQFSVVGLLTNVLVLWTVPIIMSVGMVAIVLSFIPFLGNLIFFIPLVLATYFVYIVNFTNQSWASLTLGHIPFEVLIGYYLLVLGFYLWVKQNNFKTMA